ncbi:MAG: hypothetical protein WCG44_03245 [bacterium]
MLPSVEEFRAMMAASIAPDQQRIADLKTFLKIVENAEDSNLSSWFAQQVVANCHDLLWRDNWIPENGKIELEHLSYLINNA